MRRRGILLAGLLATPLTVALAAAPTWHALDATALDALVRGAQREPRLADRMELISAAFVGAPYLLSPLGEGPGNGPDPDPRFRADAFDCTTFVETTLALALAPDLARGQQLLDVIRYRGGQADFAQRNHFPMAQWIPNNMARGFLVDITQEVGGAQTVWVEKQFGLERWRRAGAKPLLALPDAVLPQGTFRLPVLPIAAAQGLAQRFPHGAILDVVRSDHRHQPDRVSHQGLILHRGGQVWLRHAAHRIYNRVVDEPLAHHLGRLARYGKWPVTGINLLMPQRPANLEELLDAASMGQMSSSRPSSAPASRPASAPAAVSRP